jgi:hypothetical protein
VAEETESGGKSSYDCPRCGKFTITYEAMSDSNLPIGPKISAWIRNLNEHGSEVPEINRHTLIDLQKRLPNYNPREKQINLLQNIERKTEYPGQRIALSFTNDFPLAWASGDEEFLYYITSLQERGFLSSDMVSGFCRVIITAEGWDYLEKLERQLEERTQAFVAMSFSKDLKAIWEGPIYNAIKKSGYEPYRVDAKPHSNLIDVQIISEIKNSRFVLADFTYQSPGVYFETGYAQGMGLPVIRCVREDDFKKLHFDKNHYNFLIWKTPDDLEDQLYSFICAIIGKGKGT